MAAVTAAEPLVELDYAVAVDAGDLHRPGDSVTGDPPSACSSPPRSARSGSSTTSTPHAHPKGTR